MLLFMCIIIVYLTYDCYVLSYYLLVCVCLFAVYCGWVYCVMHIIVVVVLLRVSTVIIICVISIIYVMYYFYFVYYYD